MGTAILTDAKAICKKINWNSVQNKVYKLNISKPNDLPKISSLNIAGVTELPMCGEEIQGCKSIFSPELFEFARTHKMRMKNGDIVEDGLALCRMSDILPQNGILETTRASASTAENLYTRNSLHFSINHAVSAHSCGNWNESKYLFILPFSKVENIVGGSAVDIFTKGSVKLPPETVIVRQNKNLKSGTYRIIKAEEIQEFRECHGVRIVETSEKPHDISGQILYKLGYQEQKGGGFAWNEKIDSHFNNFMKQKGLFIAAHSHTPNGSTETMLHYLAICSKLKFPWQLTKNTNLKKILLKVIEDMEKFSKEQNLPLDYNTKILKEIIKTSKTPQIAVKEIQQRLKLNCLMHPINPDSLNTVPQKLFAQECRQIGKFIDIKQNEYALDVCLGRKKKLLA